MKKEEINEVKHQTWNHLQHLLGRVEELRKSGHGPTREKTERAGNLGVRGVTWPLDQVVFCREEIKYWKEMCENSGF